MSLFSLVWYIHLIVFSVLKPGPGTGKSAINAILDLWFVYTFYIWGTYREDNFSNLNLGGNYKVGFKRISTSGSHDVLMFYPVDSYQHETPVARYKYPD